MAEGVPKETPREVFGEAPKELLYNSDVYEFMYEGGKISYHVGDVYSLPEYSYGFDKMVDFSSSEYRKFNPKVFDKEHLPEKLIPFWANTGNRAFFQELLDKHRSEATERSGVARSGVERSGVERSGVERIEDYFLKGWKVVKIMEIKNCLRLLVLYGDRRILLDVHLQTILYPVLQSINILMKIGEDTFLLQGGGYRYFEYFFFTSPINYWEMFSKLQTTPEAERYRNFFWNEIPYEFVLESHKAPKEAGIVWNWESKHMVSIKTAGEYLKIPTTLLGLIWYQCALDDLYSSDNRLNWFRVICKIYKDQIDFKEQTSLWVITENVRYAPCLKTAGIPLPKYTKEVRRNRDSLGFGRFNKDWLENMCDPGSVEPRENCIIC